MGGPAPVAHPVRPPPRPRDGRPLRRARPHELYGPRRRREPGLAPRRAQQAVRDHPPRQRSGARGRAGGVRVPPGGRGGGEGTDPCAARVRELLGRAGSFTADHGVAGAGLRARRPSSYWAAISSAAPRTRSACQAPRRVACRPTALAANPLPAGMGRAVYVARAK
jgi:hypothetical protein